MLLRLLKFLNQFTHNWGVAIILLTLVVRLLVLPFNLMSYRSMKKMQMIQPKLKLLRERYKDDPAALNRETMNLMKAEKVNPLGGCLPMFLQMPVFFALYQVLGQSVELYKAPFIFWIQDLSQKDPYYVLPVLLGITLFIQHKITPTTMDPQQAKIMMWMPLIFSLFTLGLPAGLTLYIFISTLFGVIQQQIFMKDKKQEVLS
jgi:YidC/Oxa1 family membrane protein insertase